jgi:PAS domain S-box-containing protein
MILVTRRKQIYVLIIYAICIALLYLLQYYSPEIIQDYPSETQRWTDSFLTTFFVAVCIYITIRYFHKYYMIENKRAEENERDFRALSENSVDHIARYDRQHRHTYMNQSGIEFTGLPASEIIGKTHKEMGVFKEKTDDQWEEIIENVFLTKQPHTEQIESRYNNQDAYFEWRLFPEFNDRNEVVSVLGITHDITALKQSELTLKKLNSEKDKFYSVLAHDLRSPFSGLCGLTEILAEELPAMPVEKAQEMAIAIKKSTSGIYNLLVDLLDWSRINQGLIQYHPERLLLLPVISDTIQLVQDRLTDKSIQSSTDCPEDLVVFADRYMLQVIIRNLVTNAVKFTPKKGQITLSAKFQGTDKVEISLADTGIGMNKAILDNLFRIDIQTTRRGTDGEPSTGIGLLLCNEFILRHGSTLLVESEEDKGSRFTFTLPSGRD